MITLRLTDEKAAEVLLAVLARQRHMGHVTAHGRVCQEIIEDIKRGQQAEKQANGKTTYPTAEQQSAWTGA